MRLPLASVLVGEVRYRFQWASTAQEVEDLGDDYGRTYHRIQVIMLNRNTGPDQLRDTIIHEVMHCVFYGTGLAKFPIPEEDGEELLVRELTPGWVGVLRRNPKLVAYITERS